MNVVTIIGFALMAGALSVVLKEIRAEYAMAITVAAGAAVLLMLVGMSLPVISEIESLAKQANIATETVGILLKALGICYIAELAASACRDSGQTSIASKIDLAGKIAVVVLSLPMVRQLVDMIIKIMG